MEEKFLDAWFAARQKAQQLGVRLRPLEREDAMAQAHRELGGHRDSDGFCALSGKNRLDLSLEALAIHKSFTALFSDEEVNQALTRLLESGYRF